MDVVVRGALAIFAAFVGAIVVLTVLADGGIQVGVDESNLPFLKLKFFGKAATL